MDSIKVLDELIRRGWGDVAQKDIPPDWDAYPTKRMHPLAPRPTRNETRLERQYARARQARREYREAAARAAALASTPPLLITDARKRQTRAEKIEQHAAEMRYRYTLLNPTRRLRRES